MFRITIRVVLVALLMASGTSSRAQIAPRRAASPAALLAYPGFYQGQLVVVRGNLVTRDRPVLLSPAIERSIPLIFSGPSPADGLVELRASFWDVGRLQREDPRLVSLGLDRLLPGGLEGEWPRPGEIVALTVTDAMAVQPSEGPVTVRQLALDPSHYAGQKVTVTGQFRGRNLYGDVPQGPGLSQWDFVLRAADAAVWVTGLRPRGKGFSLDTGARVDTGTWLEVAGVLREGKGLVWIEGQQIAITKPAVETRLDEAPPPPQMGPPPEVIFSDPADGEIDVSLKTSIRIQFSRDMQPDSFKGRVRWAFAAADATVAGPAPARDGERYPEYKYDGARRALEIRLDLNDSASYRNVIIELLDGVVATDGAKLAPWRLAFSLGAQ